MAHPRKQIRDSVRARLWGATVAEDRVFATRMVPYRKTDLPAISVYTLEEKADDEQSAPRELRRDVDLVIEAWVGHSKEHTADDRMDAISLEIETAMHADPFLGLAFVEDSVLRESTLEVIETGDREMGIAILIYAVTYRTDAPAAPELVNEFLTAHTKHRIPGTTDDNDVEDLIDVRETP